MKNSTLCVALLVLAGMGSVGRSADEPMQAGSVDSYNVVWDSPSKDYGGSMPLGNGDIGLNAWVEKDGDLQFFISKTDAWDDNARLVKVGKVRVRLEPNPFAGEGPFLQTLSLADATLKVRAGQGERKTTVTVWVDANHPVIHVATESASPLEATAVVEPWRTRQQEYTPLQCSDIMTGAPGDRLAPTIIEPDMVLAGERGRIGWYHHNARSLGPKLLAEIQGLTPLQQEDPLLHRTFGAVVTGVQGDRVDDLRLRCPAAKTQRFNIFVLTRHPARPEQWLAEMDQVIARVEGQDFAARRRAHEQWWQEFWGRSWIRATMRPGAHAAAGVRDEADYVSQMYHLQRYVNACAGRGRYPIKFNGSIFTVPLPQGKSDPDFRRWGPGYWWMNTRLPYYSMPASGDYDLMRPLFRMYADDLLELCKFRTKLYLGHDGAYYPECIYFWGPVFSETYGWQRWDQRADKLQTSGWHKWEWVGGLELCSLMLDCYEYTLEGEFLRKTLIPFAHEILTFFEQHYKTSEQGKLVMHPSQACETWWQCTNPMPELAGCLAVTQRLLALPADAAPPAERELWRRLEGKLPALPTRDVDGKKALAPAEKFDMKRNCENPELYAVFPFRRIGLGRPNLEWGVEALEHRWDRGDHGWRQDVLFMAYLGLTDDARKALVSRARHHDATSRFPAFWGPNYDWTPDQCHGGVLLKAFQAMLLQTDAQRIGLLPAWPKEWEADFKLHAPLQTVLEGKVREGKVVDLKVTPERRRKDIVIGTTQ